LIDITVRNGRKEGGVAVHNQSAEGAARISFEGKALGMIPYI
jgi:hypothetical protein